MVLNHTFQFTIEWFSKSLQETESSDIHYTLREPKNQTVVILPNWSSKFGWNSLGAIWLIRQKSILHYMMFRKQIKLA